MTADEKNPKTDEEWKKILTPEQFKVCRKKDTERPFTGKYNDCKDAGIYKCSCCGNELFDSKTKFDSGTGWPSFFKPIKDENIKCESDHSYGMIRSEVMCKKCGAHLGHVFDDGPQPTNLRFCINSVSLDLEKKNEQ
jgi:peptide-methionine (R)-S-oxide reductase